jgi:hypothetical protein
MDRRILMLGLVGGLAVVPAMIAASSVVQAASLPTVPSDLQRLVASSPPPTLTEAGLATVKTDWSRYARRVARRTTRRVVRRRVY